MLLALLQVDRVYSAPSADNTASYFELLERNTHILYPVIALLVVTMIVAGILQAWKTQDMDIDAKIGWKREIITMLRAQLGGVPTEQISRTIGLDRLKTQKLLEEMQTEGIMISHMSSSRLQMWRLKGVGSQRNV